MAAYDTPSQQIQTVVPTTLLPEAINPPTHYRSDRYQQINNIAIMRRFIIPSHLHLYPKAADIFTYTHVLLACHLNLSIFMLQN